ncbi:MAG: hypothetical protein AAFZ58_08835 [Pseudomonadota bacterium]
MIRAQYFFKDSANGLLAWDVRRLIELSRELPIVHVAIDDIAELDEPHWYTHEGATPTCRSLLEHMRLIDEADLDYPIILDHTGRVMDGMHRVCRALRAGRQRVLAVQFTRTPDPDFVDCDPTRLPYVD